MGTFEILQQITAIFGSMMEWLGDLVGVITSNPLLLIFVISSFALIVVGLFRRLVNI